MNIICIPYHDWRKIQKEGARTRDAHLINHLYDHKRIENVIVVNRPTSFTEILFKRKQFSLEGKVLFKKGGYRLYEIRPSFYVIDYLSFDLIGPVVKGKKWFFSAFNSNRYRDFIVECINFLKIENPTIFNQNIFASNLIKNLPSFKSVFDAWDNFLLFPDNKSIESLLLAAYSDLNNYSHTWITNSTKNVSYFQSQFNRVIPLIKNGVDFEKFTREYSLPQDLSGIKKPIIGFGGKITHLFDYDLYNYIKLRHPDKSFVIVGQILSAEVFNKLEKTDNFFYLGDKSYNDYLSYVVNFDGGIIPYVSNHLDSGADSIKAYEYLAAKLPTIGTPGGGMADLSDFMKIAYSKEQFSDFLSSMKFEKTEVTLPDHHSWKSKTDKLVDIFESI